MTKGLPEAFQPRLGLSSIAAADEALTAQLPHDSRLQPIDGAVEAQLRALLQADTFESTVLKAVRPDAFDRTVLAPSRFHLLREEITSRLVELEATAKNPDQASELRAAADLLRTRSSEHQLGEALRYALLKG